ncbi:cell adhesion molecule 3-like [Ptychodera flava]|uniref:cell adhesion molecule 3-like n=1 Tax=Ptychodera flava TaxID=63121 RepID=UPI00396A4C8A
MSKVTLYTVLSVAAVMVTVTLQIETNPTVVLEGYDVLFTCTVADNSTVVRWIHGTEHITEGREIISGTVTDNARYTVIGDVSTGVYNLQIIDIRKAHAGTYICSADTLEVERRNIVVQDAIAPTTDPSCSIDTADLQEGDDVSLVCQSTGGDPKVALTWSSGGRDLVSTTTETSNDVSISLDIELTAERQGKVYTCTGRHPTYTSAKRCSLPALDIELIPRIVVTVVPVTMEIAEGKGARFECNANGDPPVTSYLWQYQTQRINDTDRRFRFDQNDNSLTVISGEKNMDGGELRCVARNKIDTRYATATITIVSAPVDEGFSFKFIAAIGGLVLFIVLIVCCIIPITVYCCYRKYNREQQRKKILRKQTKLAVISSMQGAGNPQSGVNYYVHHEDDHRRSRRHRRKDKSRVLKHNVVSPNGDARHHRDDKKDRHKDSSEAKGKEPGSNDGYLTPVTVKKRPPTPPAEHRSRSESPKRNSADNETAKETPRSQSETRRPRRPDRVSLSPGEYFKRAELEMQRHEMEELERSMTLPNEDLYKKSKKKRRKKRSRDSKHKRDRSPDEGIKADERTEND